MSDYETIQRKRNIIVGIFVLVAMCAFVWLIIQFGELPTVASQFNSFQVFVQFPEAPGVQKNTPVRFCGYQIGRVTDVMSPEPLRNLNTGKTYYQTKVIIRIDKKYVNIPSNVRVRLMTRGLGSSYIEFSVDPDLPLKPIDPNRPETSFLVDKTLLQGSSGMTSEFFPEESQKKLDKLVTDISIFIQNANDILGNADNKKNITLALEHAVSAMNEFEKFSTAGTAAVNDMDTAFKRAAAAIVDVSEELSKVAAQLRVTLGRINEGQGTVGMLINDGRLYEKLLEDTNQLQLLLEQLRALVDKFPDKGIPIKLK